LAASTSPLPNYACAILRNDRGELLLERRPVSAVFAGGQWTCFGGRREQGEEPEAALRRELREELGWEPATLQWAVELWVGAELIAWFYEAVCSLEITDLRLEPGRGAGWLTRRDRATLLLSPWHAAVLEAWEQRQSRVDLPS